MQQYVNPSFWYSFQPTSCGSSSTAEISQWKFNFYTWSSVISDGFWKKSLRSFFQRNSEPSLNNRTNEKSKKKKKNRILLTEIGYLGGNEEFGGPLIPKVLLNISKSISYRPQQDTCGALSIGRLVLSVELECFPWNRKEKSVHLSVLTIAYQVSQDLSQGPLL